MVNIGSFVYYQTHLKILSKFIRLLPFPFKFYQLFVYLSHVCLCTHVHVHTQMPWRSEDNMWRSIFLLTWGSQGSDSGYQAWMQVSLSAALSQPVLFCFKDDQRVNAEKSAVDPWCVWGLLHTMPSLCTEVIPTSTLCCLLMKWLYFVFAPQMVPLPETPQLATWITARHSPVVL